MFKTGQTKQGSAIRFASFQLEYLGLRCAELAALKENGHVSQELRGRNCLIFKIRFRISGRQTVRYLGANPQLAEAVRTELERLRRPIVNRANLRSLTREGKRGLRRSKLTVFPTVEVLEHRFHGFALRRRRRARV